MHFLILRAYHSLRGNVRIPLASEILQLLGPSTPHLHLRAFGLGYSPFTRRYLENHYCFLFLFLLRCFNSERFRSLRILDIY